MKLHKIALILFSSFLISALLLLFFYPRNLTNVVGTSTTFATISANHQRKTFYANGYHWIFHCNGSHILYSTSNDGSSWSTPFIVRKGISSSGICVWYDGNIHTVYASGVPGTPVFYRRGSISGNTIEWEDEQTAVSGVEGHEYYNGYCITDSNGYPWAAYIENDGFYWSSSVVRATSTNGSSWNASSKISEPSINIPRTSILPLNDGKVYAIYATTNEVRGKLWNGTAWRNEENITMTKLAQDYGYSAISHNDDIHLALLENDTNNILHFKRTSATGWQDKVIIEAHQTFISFPVLSVDKLTGNLYCFWIYNNSLRMKKCVNDTWEGSSSDPFGTTFCSPRSITCFYQVWDQKIGIACLEDLNGTYRLRYKFLTIHP